MIDWLSALVAGIAGGIAMGVWAMMMHMLGITRMNMTNYEGCMITGQDSGGGTTMAGMMMHLLISMIVGFMYAFGFYLIWRQSGVVYGLILGIVHWIIGGMVLPMMDGMNRCVKGGGMQGMQFFATGYGPTALLTFLIGHLIYGAVVGVLYRVPGM